MNYKHHCEYFLYYYYYHYYYYCTLFCLTGLLLQSYSSPVTNTKAFQEC